MNTDSPTYAPPPDLIEQIKARFNLTDEELGTHAVILSDVEPHNMELARVVKLPQEEQAKVLLAGVKELAKKHNLSVEQHNAIAMVAIEAFNDNISIDQAAERVKLATARIVPNIAPKSKPQRRAALRQHLGKKGVVMGHTTKERRRALAKALKNGTAKFVQHNKPSPPPKPAVVKPVIVHDEVIEYKPNEPNIATKSET